MYLKNLLLTLILATSLGACSLKCRSPEEIRVINPIKKNDTKLSCEALTLEMIEAQAQMLNSAKQKEEIEAYAVMPHCLHTTLMKVDRALNAAKTRVEYINNLQSHKKCNVGLGFQRFDSPDIVNQPINEETIAEEHAKISQKKIAPIKTAIPANSNQ